MLLLGDSDVVVFVALLLVFIVFLFVLLLLLSDCCMLFGVLSDGRFCRVGRMVRYKQESFIARKYAN